MKFSVAIPTFKARFLKECISSVLNQSFNDFEIIIVNDNSPDPIDNMIKEFDDKRIRYFKNKSNIGSVNLVDNWNLCLSYSTGDYFILLGDDDKLNKDYLKYFNNTIRLNSIVDVFHCRSYIIDQNSRIIDITPSLPEKESIYENISQRMFNKRVQFISDFAFRTSKLKSIGGFYSFPLGWCSDDVTSFIMATSNGIVHINKPLLYYRRNSLSISSTGNFIYKLDAINKLKFWFENFFDEELKNNQNDIYLINLKNGLNGFINKRKVETIINSYNYSGIIYTLSRLISLKISVVSKRIILYSAIELLKQRYRDSP